MENAMAAKTAVAVKKQPRELSEEEILKAPEKDYMNEAQLAFFRKRLTDIRDQILRNADDTGEHLRENEITTDPSDRATLEEEYTLELRTRDRERKLLKKVEKSLRMIEDGSYGYCEETGEPIGVPRLIARPMTTLSIESCRCWSSTSCRNPLKRSPRCDVSPSPVAPSRPACGTCVAGLSRTACSWTPPRRWIRKPVTSAPGTIRGQ